MGESNKEKLDLQKVIGDLHQQNRLLTETLKVRDSLIAEMRIKIEPPLEVQNIHLQQKNKYLHSQLRMIKMKYDQILMEAQQDIREKAVEIEVLKEMIKAVQVQLKTKDQEFVRLNKKILQADGMKLAKQLHQNITIFNNYRTGNEVEMKLPGIEDVEYP